jgi:hypothetical protein
MDQPILSRAPFRERSVSSVRHLERAAAYPAVGHHPDDYGAYSGATEWQCIQGDVCREWATFRL